MDKKLLIFTLCILLSYSYAVSAAPSGASANVLNSTRGPETVSTSADTQGGNITNTTLDQDAITLKWAGLYGTIAATFQLADSSGSVFFDWSVNDVSNGTVYAVNGSATPDWSALSVASINDLPSYLATGADSFSNTFTGTESFNSTSINLANAPVVRTYNFSQNAIFATYALNDTSSRNYIFAGRALNNEVGFNNNTLDFQIIVPSQGVTTYYFYLEMQ